MLFAFFFGAREDQPGLLRSRAICRLSQIFSEILQDRHRPPSDLADGLMRNSTSRQNASFGQKIGIPVSWARISRGGSPLRGKLTFFRTQLTARFVLTALNEFANRGKLSGKLAQSFWQA
jgi:hypothetical protein